MSPAVENWRSVWPSRCRINFITLTVTTDFVLNLHLSSHLMAPSTDDVGEKCLEENPIDSPETIRAKPAWLVFPLETKLIEFIILHLNDFQILVTHVSGEVEAESEDDDDDDDDCKKGSMDEVCDLETRLTTKFTVQFPLVAKCRNAFSKWKVPIVIIWLCVFTHRAQLAVRPLRQKKCLTWLSTSNQWSFTALRHLKVSKVKVQDSVS